MSESIQLGIPLVASGHETWIRNVYLMQTHLKFKDPGGRKTSKSVRS